MVCVLVIMYDYVDLARIKLSSCRDNSHLSICVVISCGFELIHLSGNPWRFSSGDPTHLVNASCYIYIYIYIKVSNKTQRKQSHFSLHPLLLVWPCSGREGEREKNK